jgi:hypothetical protein
VHVSVNRFLAAVCVQVCRQIKVHLRENAAGAPAGAEDVLAPGEVKAAGRRRTPQRALKHHGGGNVSYIGLVKVNFQVAIAAVLHDAKFLMRALDSTPGGLIAQGAMSA